jgi:hypothetical protein
MASSPAAGGTRGRVACKLSTATNAGITRIATYETRDGAVKLDQQGEEPVAGFLQAIGDGAMLEPPFADRER